MSLGLGLEAGTAHAQATRTWISGVGDDANPCSRTAPCKTFAGAISKTAPAGEINCLDPGGFGALTITKSISIICTGVEGGVLVSGTNGFVVNLTSVGGGRVVLDGLDFEGINTGLSGVSMVGPGNLIIRNSTIRNFINAGVNLSAPTATPAPRVLVQNTLITNNGTASAGAGTPNGGIYVSGVSGAVNNAEVLNSVIDGNNSTGITVNGPSSLVLAGSTITGQATGISVSAGGNVISYGNNVVRNAGAPTQTLPLQ
jgi:hypothetical protein